MGARPAGRNAAATGGPIRESGDGREIF